MKIYVNQSAIQQYLGERIPVTINGVTQEERRNKYVAHLSKIAESQYLGSSGYDEYPEEQDNG